MYQSEQINELATALAKAQGQMQHAIKDSSNPHYKSKYADLASVIDAIRAPLSENGLSFVQPIRIENDVTVLDTILFHSSGQWIKSSMIINVEVANRNAIQALGSYITYSRRYSLSSLIGITQDDDDGNSSTQTTVATQIQAQIQAQEKVKPVQYINAAQILWIENTFRTLGDNIKNPVMERLSGSGCTELQKIPLEWFSHIQSHIDSLVKEKDLEIL